MAIPNELYEKEIDLTRVYYNHIILPTEITFFDLSNSNNKIIFIGFSNLQRNMYTGHKKFSIDLNQKIILMMKKIKKLKHMSV